MAHRPSLHPTPRLASQTAGAASASAVGAAPRRVVAEVVWLSLLAAVALAGPLAACSSSDADPAAAGRTTGDDDDQPTSDDDDDDRPGDRDGGGRDDAGKDGGEGVDGGAALREKEPNDGKTADEIDTMPMPGAMAGAIDPANDVDLFSAALNAGEFWEWSLTPTSAELAPHITIFDTAKGSLNPTVLASAAAGQTTTLQHFVLGAGAFVAAVRDARNVPTATGKGGSGFGYQLVAKKATPAPVQVDIPATKSGTLKSLSSVDFYAFSLVGSTALDIVVNAARKPAPSTLDSRISLFDLSRNKNVLTNDDASGSTTDSAIGGTIPAGSFLLIVENEGTNGADLSYTVSFTKR